MFRLKGGVIWDGASAIPPMTLKKSLFLFRDSCYKIEVEGEYVEC